jgi:hypothetical protein
MYDCPADRTQPLHNVDPLFKLVMSGIKKDKGIKNFNFRIKVEPDEQGDE